MPSSESVECDFRTEQLRKLGMVRSILQSPVQSFRGKNLDFPLCTIPTVSLYEKYGDFSLETIELETVVLHLDIFHHCGSLHAEGHMPTISLDPPVISPPKYRHVLSSSSCKYTPPFPPRPEITSLAQYILRTVQS